MQLTDIYTQLEQTSSKLETPLFQNIPSQNISKSQSKLSMIWTQEFDGKRYCLVAKWVQQN